MNHNQKPLKIVMTDCEYPDTQFEEAVIAQLEKNVLFIQAQCKTEADVIELAADADGIINQYAPITGKVIAKLKKCQVISRLGVGVDSVDLKAAEERGIWVANVPNYCMDEVSDHTMALLLSWARKIPFYDQVVKTSSWDYKMGTPIFSLRDKVIGLVGYGKIAQLLAAKATAFGMKIMFYDPYVTGGPVHAGAVQASSLEELMAESDFISVHTPLNDATRGLIAKPLLELMKPTAVIINTSRGPIINETDLIEALETGKLAGAALDVIEQEPIDRNHPFLRMPQVILTPHVAWYSEESQAKLRVNCTLNVMRVLQGEAPLYAVNKPINKFSASEA
ncbi:C-terminal binding protein [Cohnella abietis]|uniref:Dehydrogenase n=1 Tax=Cohnella abietis TaxID=2507935 RepID=A0A3T1DCF0_9BACL|nr:C-terminal binding protein [Cohnella abietis]BBI35615.1 dehydrogenase [Cohnella abietis]